jgi:hypothetical protein
LCEHFGVDQNDPEQRIRDLERQLADAQKAAQDSGQRAREDAMGWGGMPPPPIYTASAPPAYTPPPPPTYMSPPPPMQRFTSESYGYPTYAPNGYRAGRGGPRVLRRIFVFLLLLVVGPLAALVYFTHHLPTSGNFGSIISSLSSAVRMPGSYAGPKACDVLTVDMVKPILGDDATITRNTQGRQSSDCMYHATNGVVEVEVGGSSYIKPHGSNRQAVPDLGDDAWIWARTLYVRKGTTGLKVLVAGAISTSRLADNEAAEYDAEKAIAGQLLPKL